MQDKSTHALFEQMTGRSIDAVTLWAETSQRVLRELVELGSGVAREGVQLCADLQRGALEAAREGQAAGLRWQASWTELASKPEALYRKAIDEGVNGAQAGFRLTEESAQALARATERVQAAAEAASKGIQETCAGAAARLREIYAAE